MRRLILTCLCTDARAAELLSQINEATIRELDRRGWSLKRVEDLAVPGLNPHPWTERSVGHHRREQGLPANHAGLDAANAARRKAHRGRQVDAGLWFLLPNPDTGAAGWDLWASEYMVLSLLRECGPMTRGQVLQCMESYRPTARHGQSVFRRLIEVGLVEIRDGVVALTEKALPPRRVRSG